MVPQSLLKSLRHYVCINLCLWLGLKGLSMLTRKPESFLPLSFGAFYLYVTAASPKGISSCFSNKETSVVFRLVVQESMEYL